VDVDVVVVTHQSGDHLARALDALPDDVSVVVVDNQSTDGSVAVARDAGATVVENDVNAGFAAGANQGAALGDGELVLFLNPDAVIDGPNLHALVAGLERAGPTAGIASPRIRYDTGEEQRVAWHFPTSTVAWREALGLHRWMPHDATWGFVVGSCFLVRRSVFESLGGFDTRFWLYGEEADLCRRAANTGVHAMVVDDAIAVHVGGASGHEQPAMVTEHFLRGTERFIAKYEGRAGLVSWRVANVVGASIRSCLPGPAERRALHRSRLRRYARELRRRPASVGLDNPATAAREHTLVVCSLEQWDEVWRRNQFLVRELADADPNLRVLFIEPPLDVIHRLRGHPGRRRQRGLRPVRGDGRVLAFEPVKVLPRLLGPATDRSLVRQVRRAARELGFDEPSLWINDPSLAGLLATGWPTVYDITDDWLAADVPRRARRRLERDERRLLRRADEVVVCSDDLARTRRGLRPDLRVIPNAVDVEHFRRPHERPADLPRSPVAVYVGTLHEHRLDIDLVLDVAASHPDLHVTLVGPVALSEQSRQRLDAVTNISMLGTRAYADVPGYLQHADVVLVPHVRTAFTESLDPIKAYECVAAGRPTVATDIAGFRELGGNVRAVSSESFIDAVADALGYANQPAILRDVPAWGERAREFAAALRAARARGDHTHVRRRIAFIDHCALLSGGELALLRLISALDDVDAHVILGEDGPLAPRLREAGAQVEVLALDPEVRSTRRGEVHIGGALVRRAIKTGQDIQALRRRLREVDPDLLHTNSLKAAIYGGIAGRLEGIPVVWHIRDRIASDYLRTDAVLAIRALALVIPDCIVFNSQASRTACNVRVPFRVIPSPVIYDSAAGHARLQQPSDHAQRFVMVGRLAPWKGQHIFLRAFARAFPNGPETAIIAGSAMFGEDDYVAELQGLARDLRIVERVDFVGFVDDVAGLLQHADVLVHASVIAEPFGQVVIEGMAAGLPVIATAGGGPLEIITDKVDGVLVPPNDAAALAEALVRLRDDASLRRRLGAAALVRAADFSVDHVAEQVRETWESVLAGRP
jgi:glycosyltransferase involved in cell wall biosynthesis